MLSTGEKTRNFAHYRTGLLRKPVRSLEQVGATDLDCGVNSEVRYRIKETNVDTFTIDEMTGKICLAKHLDHERQDSYGFTVVASDKGTKALATPHSV